MIKFLSYKVLLKKVDRIERKTLAFVRVLYKVFVKPKSSDEALRRKEFIFNILMIGALLLIVIATMYSTVNSITRPASYDGTSPVVLIIPTLILLGLFWHSRRGFTTTISYVFVLIFLLLASYALWAYSYVLAEGLLMYAVVIVMAGVLISTRAAWSIFIATCAYLTALAYLQTHRITVPNTEDVFKTFKFSNVVIYIVMFSVILIVSWLYNRDIESSLRRAHISEKALKKERNTLEIKVRERTKQLEQAHVENMLELHRFSEFGRLSATLLHELANPLTSVSLELEQLELKGYKEAVSRARQGVAHMEEYVVAARRQLSSQSEEKEFKDAIEIAKVINFLQPKAHTAGVRLIVRTTKPTNLYGDTIRFNQIIANLVSNAIDASVDVPDDEREVSVVTSRTKQYFVLKVHDNGRGIASSDMHKIFQPFYTTKRSERGTGIGLYITKQAVEETFKGSINVTSTKQKGTTFTVKIPINV